jgi:chromosome segregation ATPase
VYHLPAYLALERWVPGRVVVVVAPEDLEGARLLRDAGARVLVIGGDIEPEPGLEVRAGALRLPLRPASVDLVVCLERFGHLEARERATLLDDARRCLKTTGAFVAWLEQPQSRVFGESLGGGTTLDFWTFEDELRAAFDRVELVAQMPWSGFSLAPVDDQGNTEPKLALAEGLLAEPPEASHYLAVASVEPSGIARTLSAQCLLVPVPLDLDVTGASEEMRRQLADARDEVDRMREEFGVRAAKAAAAHARVRELEEQLAALRVRAGEVEAADVARLRDGLHEAEAQLASTRTRCAQLQDELDGLMRLRADLEARNATSTEQAAAKITELERALADTHQRQGSEAELLRSRQTDLAILQQTSAERERVLERATSQVERLKASHDELREKLASQREQALKHAAERDELRRQVDVAVAEREGSRALAARVEAELEVARRRLADQEEELAGKIREASRTTGELEGLRLRLGEQDRVLAQTRSRAEELSASAAQGAEQGRMLADVALDRDRLRDELGQRSRQLEELEAKFWEARDALQRERLEGVRLTGEAERLRERIDRDRQVEADRSRQVEELGKAYREAEQRAAELAAILRTREQRIDDLVAQQSLLHGQSEDTRALREELLRRSEILAHAQAELEQLRAQVERATKDAERHETERLRTSEEMRQFSRKAEEQTSLVGTLRAEIDIRALEVQQVEAKVTELQGELDRQRARLRERDEQKAELQHKLEEAAAARQNLRRRLREREQELEDLAALQENHGLELFKLRRELESAATANEELTQALAAGDSADGDDDEHARWPAAARLEVERLRRALSERSVAAAAEPDRLEEMERAVVGAEQERVRRLVLELSVRVREQEAMLGALDAAEQKIWEMTDAADRNAARFQASLAQLEKHKEVVDELNDEIDVTRTLLAAEQARALENERLLASERAKLARAGLSLDGFPADAGGATDDVFRDLADEHGAHRDLTALGDDGVPGEIRVGESEPLDLGPPGMPLDMDLARLAKRSDSPRPADSGTFTVPGTHRVRLTIEVGDDEDWDDDG